MLKIQNSPLLQGWRKPKQFARLTLEDMISKLAPSYSITLIGLVRSYLWEIACSGQVTHDSPCYFINQSSHLLRAIPTKNGLLFKGAHVISQC